jgi:hypothetical protein
MYGLIVKVTVVPGRRDEMISILVFTSASLRPSPNSVAAWARGGLLLSDCWRGDQHSEK